MHLYPHVFVLQYILYVFLDCVSLSVGSCPLPSLSNNEYLVVHYVSFDDDLGEFFITSNETTTDSSNISNGGVYKMYKEQELLVSVTDDWTLEVTPHDQIESVSLLYRGVNYSWSHVFLDNCSFWGKTVYANSPLLDIERTDPNLIPISASPYIVVPIDGVEHYYELSFFDQANGRATYTYLQPSNTSSERSPIIFYFKMLYGYATTNITAITMDGVNQIYHGFNISGHFTESYGPMLAGFINDSIGSTVSTSDSSTETVSVESGSTGLPSSFLSTLRSAYNELSPGSMKEKSLRMYHSSAYIVPLYATRNTGLRVSNMDSEYQWQQYTNTYCNRSVFVSATEYLCWNNQAIFLVDVNGNVVDPFIDTLRLKSCPSSDNVINSDGMIFCLRDDTTSNPTTNILRIYKFEESQGAAVYNVFSVTYNNALTIGFGGHVEMGSSGTTIFNFKRDNTVLEIQINSPTPAPGPKSFLNVNQNKHTYTNKNTTLDIGISDGFLKLTDTTYTENEDIIDFVVRFPFDEDVACTSGAVYCQLPVLLYKFNASDSKSVINIEGTTYVILFVTSSGTITYVVNNPGDSVTVYTKRESFGPDPRPRFAISSDGVAAISYNNVPMLYDFHSILVSNTDIDNCPSVPPTLFPTVFPTTFPTGAPTQSPTQSPTISPTQSPTQSPTISPTLSPTLSPGSPPTFDVPTVTQFGQLLQLGHWRRLRRLFLSSVGSAFVDSSYENTIWLRSADGLTMYNITIERTELNTFYSSYIEFFGDGTKLESVPDLANISSFLKDKNRYPSVFPRLDEKSVFVVDSLSDLLLCDSSTITHTGFLPFYAITFVNHRDDNLHCPGLHASHGINNPLEALRFEFEYENEEPRQAVFQQHLHCYVVDESQATSLRHILTIINDTTISPSDGTEAVIEELETEISCFQHEFKKNGQCLSLQQCSSIEIEVKEPTSTSDRICLRALREEIEILTDEALEASDSPFADTPTPSPIHYPNPCPPNTYKKYDNTLGSSVCTSIKKCLYIKVEATPTSDRVCATYGSEQFIYTTNTVIFSVILVLVGLRIYVYF